MKKQYKKSYIFSSFFMIAGFLLIMYEMNNKYQFEPNKIIVNESENQNINLEIEKDNYISVLEIPKINLKKELYPINSYNNNVDINIQILKESKMPDIENSNLILAGHSGIGPTAYFNNLHKLNVGDVADIYYNKTKYVYKLMNIYKVKKIGKVPIKRNKLKNTLTLITCYSNNKQLIFIFELINKNIT